MEKPRVFYGDPQPIISTLEVKSRIKEITKFSVYGIVVFGILVAISDATKLSSLVISNFINFLLSFVGFWTFMKIRNIYTEYVETKFHPASGILETHTWDGTKLVRKETEE